MSEERHVFPEERSAYLMTRAIRMVHAGGAWTIVMMLAYLSIDFGLIMTMHFAPDGLFAIQPALRQLPAAHMMIFITGLMYLAIPVFLVGMTISITRHPRLIGAIVGLILGPACVLTTYSIDGTRWVQDPVLHYYLAAFIGLLAGRFAHFGMPKRHF